ncbi:hypothetical protein [Sandaracinus amylolyticus]|uniref:hypothetical protein n=1 Tax=Sandaracinus amylolyticus TaxID=927083 RepID=UPI001F1B1B0C|nr:hypothetical protein [Sandaracinus amylolyticus]UJR83569.1 Hypothetical protein I5071_56370 [Sandaracinus amylolyticus]
MLRALVIASVLLVVPSLVRAQDAPSDDPMGRAVTLRLGLGASGIVGPDRAGITGHFGVQIPLVEWVSIDVIAQLGVDPWDAQGRMWIALAAGVRGELPLDAWRPYLAARIAHVHDAPLHAWGDHFGETLAGDPAHGLGHLTALGGALGVTWEVPGTQRRLVLGVEAEALGLIHGSAHHGRSPDAWLGGSVSVGWQLF